MVKIAIGELGLYYPEQIKDTSDWFDAEYEQSWFQSSLAKAIVKDVDNTIYVSGEYFESPVFGGIPPRDLSTGCKSLLLLLNEEHPIRGERFGDNCAKWILEIGRTKDVIITVNHCLKFPEPFEIESVNSGKILRTYKEYINEIVDVVSEAFKDDKYNS